MQARTSTPAANGGPEDLGCWTPPSLQWPRSAIKRGAVVTVHAAARLGMIDRLKELIAGDPALVNARGGDGQTPLHFASTIEISAYLLDQGADINARDVDHESTPAQYMVRSRPEIARYLIQSRRQIGPPVGGRSGRSGAGQEISAGRSGMHPHARERQYFPKANFHAGGTVYQWELGWHVSACQVAKNSATCKYSIC